MISGTRQYTTEVLALTIDLCARASVTPTDAGCQDVVAARLDSAGFTVEAMPFGDVSNLWATHGCGSPVTVLLGHTDVVPAGELRNWTSAPFAPTLRDGALYARGAADMKGSVAAMAVALESFVKDVPDHVGTVALLLTSDEEGVARDGVRRVVEEFRARSQHIDYCVVGEPSSHERLGDTIRVGRRGSLHARITVHGVEGHVAYPDLARNPIHAVAPALAELAVKVWDEGNEGFPPTTFQVSNIHAGGGTTNVIPGELVLDCNFRFGTASTQHGLERALEEVMVRHGVRCDIAWDLSGAPFHTPPGKLRDAVLVACREVCEIEPRADTGGGTSDGRFIAPLGAEVVELGPRNASIHKIDEHIALADLERLPALYRAVLGQLHGAQGPPRR